MGAIRLGAVVGDGGRVELKVPLPAGTAVEVLVRDAAGTDDEDWPGIEWDEHLQARLDSLDREGVDPRPWREVVAELRERFNPPGTRS
ncbi:MAG: hypothetical protein J2P46_12840 [Zavarzinella sp.]|nr:hypothetical protein [Zavarzinella sp.]